MVSRRQVIAGTLAAGATSLDARRLGLRPHRLADWYVATRQPVDVGRLPDGRYFLPFVGTSVVLRPELPEGHVGIGSESPSRL